MTACALAAAAHATAGELGKPARRTTISRTALRRSGARRLFLGGGDGTRGVHLPDRVRPGKLAGLRANLLRGALSRVGGCRAAARLDQGTPPRRGLRIGAAPEPRRRCSVDRRHSRYDNPNTTLDPSRITNFALVPRQLLHPRDHLQDRLLRTRPVRKDDAICTTSTARFPTTAKGAWCRSPRKPIARCSSISSPSTSAPISGFTTKLPALHRPGAGLLSDDAQACPAGSRRRRVRRR